MSITAEDAIRWCQKLTCSILDRIGEPDEKHRVTLEVMEACTDALKKELGLPPMLIQHDFGVSTYGCRSCHTWLTTERITEDELELMLIRDRRADKAYCPHCGTRVVWEV